MAWQVDFTAAAVVGVTNYHWDFGDSSTEDTGATPTVTHVYTAAGTYNVVVTATTPSGDQSTGPCPLTLTCPDFASDATAFTSPAWSSQMTTTCGGPPDCVACSIVDTLAITYTSVAKALAAPDTCNETGTCSSFIQYDRIFDCVFTDVDVVADFTLTVTRNDNPLNGGSRAYWQSVPAGLQTQLGTVSASGVDIADSKTISHPTASTTRVSIVWSWHATIIQTGHGTGLTYELDAHAEMSNVQFTVIP